MAKYVCTVCGYEYDPAAGDPDSGIAPGTAFEDIPDDWVCPLCGVGKDSFTKVEQRLPIGVKIQTEGANGRNSRTPCADYSEAECLFYPHELRY